MNRTAVIVALALCAPAIARADEATAKAKFEAGEHAYNLGQFKKAIELFTGAYDEYPSPAFLFNIAQSYRQDGNCKQALFFYKRFLGLKEEDKSKPLKPELQKEVEARIDELEECVRREIANKPPTTLDNGQQTTTAQQPGTTNPTTTTATKPTTVATAPTATNNNEEDDDDHPRVTAQATFRPKVLALRVYGGAAKISAGALDTPMQASFVFVGGYPLAIAPKAELDLGIAATFTPLPYSTTSNGDGTASLLGVLANAGFGYAAIPKVVVRGDLGIGAQVMSGIDKTGNPFTSGGNPATGSLSTFLFRVAASADYAITNNVVVTATPIAFAYSPAPTGFLSSISSLTSISFLVGVGYRQ